VYVIYFPSRFDLPVDAKATAALRSFGERTGSGTSVNVWDPTDPEFSRALHLFGVISPPGVVLAGGSKRVPTSSHPLDPGDLYAISFTDPFVLEDAERLASAVNSAHEVLARGDPREITRYVRAQAASALLTTLGNIASGLRATSSRAW
jgi:hypothetical protein